jgi:fatty acid desaturase
VLRVSGIAEGVLGELRAGIHRSRRGERFFSPKKGAHMSPLLLVLLIVIVLVAVGGGVLVHNLLWLLLVLALVVVLWNLLAGRTAA